MATRQSFCQEVFKKCAAYSLRMPQDTPGQPAETEYIRSLAALIYVRCAQGICDLNEATSIQL